MPVFASPPLTVMDVHGADAARVANNLCTAALLQLTVGIGCEAFFTDVRGKTLGHGCVYATHSGLRLIGAANQATKLAAHFDRYTIREDAVVTDLSDKSVAWIMDGNTLRRLAPAIEFPRPVQPHLLAYQAIAGGEWPAEIAAYQVPWFGTPSSVGDAVDGPAILLVGDRSTIAPWLAERRAEFGDEGLPHDDDTPHPAAQGDFPAFHAHRVRARFPWYGIDLDEKNLPQELDRDPLAISFQKGCYLGQETVARLDALGQVQKKLVLWQVHSATCPPPNTELSAGEQVVGRLTSVVAGDAPNQWLALGYARRSHFEPGSKARFGDGEAVVVASHA